MEIQIFVDKKQVIKFAWPKSGPKCLQTTDTHSSIGIDIVAIGSFLGHF